MADALMALPDAVDAHQAGLHQCRALALGQFGMDDDVDVACFVFQCDEYCSFGGLGALTPGHYSAGPGQASVGVVTAKGCRRNEASGLQGMAPKSAGVDRKSVVGGKGV